MNTLQSLLVSMTTLLLISATLARTQPRFMHDGKEYDDEFYELISKQAPVKLASIIRLALSWDAEKQLKHFELLNELAKKDDNQAKFAQNIIDGTREILKRSLNEVGYQKEMTLEQYLDATYKIQKNEISKVNPDILEGIQLLEKISDDTLEKILNEGAQEELNWELDNLHPYEIKFNPDPEVVSEQLEIEGSPVPQKQESDEFTLELLETKELTPESQQVNESTPESQKPRESTPKLRKPTEEIPEEQKTVDEILAEPSQSDNAISDTHVFKDANSPSQTSQETASNPQELKRES